MKLKLPRSLHMRIMLSIALLQFVLISAFSVFWIFEEVGNELGVTRERVRQIQMEALKRLREILERDGFSMDVLLK